MSLTLAKAAAAGSSTGPSALLGLLLLTEAGLPIPIPADLMMLLLGERVAAGTLPLLVAVLALQVIAVVGTLALYWAARGPGNATIRRLGPRIGLTEERLERANGMLQRRGTFALALGRSTPGLRTVTVVAAAGSGMGAGPAILGLILGSTIFVQGHFFLGLALGEAARTTFERLGAVSLAILALLGLVGLIVWLARRRGRQGFQTWTEACCPACLALGAVVGSDRPVHD